MQLMERLQIKTITKQAASFIVVGMLSAIFINRPGSCGEETQLKPLEGAVSEEAVTPGRESLQSIIPMPAPVLKKPLEATLQKNELNGEADEADEHLKSMTPESAPGNILRGNAQMEDTQLTAQDPDVEDQELMVEWDRWRNRFLRAIQQGVIESMASTGDNMMRWDPVRQTMVSRIPLGAVAWFSCQVTPDRRIVNLTLTHPSGFATYDRVVLESIKVLEGSSILRYPKGSHRQIVLQEAGIKTSAQQGQSYFHFGDVERYTVPGY